MKVPTVQVGIGEFGYANDIRMGVVAYRDEFTNWTLRKTGRLMRPFPGDDLTGAIVAIQNEDLKERWLQTGVPVVNVSSSTEAQPFASVLVDNGCVGELAADHFIDRHFENFAYVGPENILHSIERERGFRARVRAEKGSYFRYIPEDQKTNSFINALSLPCMGVWLKDLPKPCGIFCSDDAVAVKLLNKLLSESWEVPAQFALLGVNNDEVLCSFARRPLSSVIINGRKIGYEAADMLHGMMNSGKVKKRVRLVRPVRVAARISTDITANQDEVVARGLQFIRKHITQPLVVQDIAESIGVSKRLLERQFSRHLEHGPAEEITRQRMRRAKHLLVNTDWRVYKIAQACGYPDYSLFSTTFSRREGISPNRWRQQELRKSKQD